MTSPVPKGEAGAAGVQRRIVYLLDAATPLEVQVLQTWIAGQGPEQQGAIECISIPASRGRRERLDRRLEVALTADDDPLLAPLRVAWQPPRRDGVHEARLTDLLTFGDPRDPGPLRQKWIMRTHPERCAVVVGEPATVSDLRERWRQAAGIDTTHTLGFADFVARQAALALERAERRLRGTRYKVPRFVHEEILSRPSFQAGMARLARDLRSDEASLKAKAARYLKEIAATHSTYVIDLVANLVRMLYRRGYGALHYDAAELERVYALAQRHPVVFLPSHKSNLDHLVLQYALHVNGHPPNHTAGGINMNFFPVGPLVRRSGVFFIRRTFKDNPVYKFVLQQYIDYLIEKRFPLEWYIEGGRSRSGKLLPPRFGMLAYVVDAYRRGKSEDVHLIPVSIAYDQIQDVGDYVAEQTGAAKQRESFGWFVGVIRRLRRRYGNIHIRFGAPLSLAEALGPPDPEAEPNPDEHSLTLQKLAFEVCVRINRVTPITPTSLVTFALLCTEDRALTLPETHALVHELAEAVRRRKLPTTTTVSMETPADVEAALDALVDSGVLTRYAKGTEPVYVIGPEQQLTAAYYRNSITHFFLHSAITQLALLLVVQANDARADGSDLFWDEVFRLRDLFKFEFFFSPREVFRDEVTRELCELDPQWQDQLASGSDGARRLLERSRPYTAHGVLRPFAEAYRVLADVLLLPDTAGADGPALIDRCMGLGTQYHLQRRIRSAEAVSQVLFQTALDLAKNRGFLDNSPGRQDLRQTFARELRDLCGRINDIEACAAEHFADLSGTQARG